MGVLENIREQYPTLSFLVNDPEIGPLLRDAVDPNKGFSPQTFQAKLYQTGWWKRQSSSEREWLIKSKTDPGTAKRERTAYRGALSTAANRYGAQLTNAQETWLTELGLARGLAPDDPSMLAQFRQIVAQKPSAGGPGARRTGARAVQQMARGDYGIRMSKGTAATWGDRLARGLTTMDDVRVTLADKATQMYPQFATGLRQGQTIRDMTDGYREIIASELELDPERIDFTEGRWSKVLNWRGSKGLRAPTAQEVQKLARMDTRWWSTSHGRQTDAEMTSGVLQMFGKRAPMGMGGSR